MASRRADSLPPDTETWLAGFTELVAAAIANDRARANPNVVKVAGTRIGEKRLRAVSFTRVVAAAPAASAGAEPVYHHIGLYAFRRAALERFVALRPSPREQKEKLEQLRALDAGMRIDAVIVEGAPIGVDTPEDLEKARAMLTKRS